MPDAPAPTYDSRGNEVAEWTVRVRYDAVRDCIEVHWSQEAGPYHRAARHTDTFDVVDVEDVIAHLQRRIRILGARRLF